MLLQAAPCHPLHCSAPVVPPAVPLPDAVHGQQLSFIFNQQAPPSPCLVPYASLYLVLQMAAIQRLMGALCFSKRVAAGRASPYDDLLTEDLWGNLGGCLAA